jgi:hypothetical protein
VNIIQISEQLKDVPDQFLMQEIQNPTGSYPSYLVVSELTRRKRMREGAIKQEPITSVAEDLVGISGTPQAAQSTLGAAQQMMAQPQQMPMPEMGMNVPETGTPMMATGGLVAFEQGGPIRAQEGLFVDPTQLISEPGAPLQFKVRDMFTGGIYNEMAGLKKAGFTDAEISQMSPEQRTQMFRSIQKESAGVPSGAEIEKRMAPAMAQPTQQSPIATGATAGATQRQPSPGGLGAFKTPAPPPAPASLQSLSEQEISRIREAGIAEREEMIPDRTSKLLEERILRKTEQLQKDKDMSFNEALFAAGAAILSAPGGGGMKWAGEGLKAFGQTLSQGKKDMRKSQDLLDQANIDLANAQMLRDQGRLDAADKAERKAQDRIDRSNALLTTQASLARQQWQDQITAAKLPYEMAETGAKAGYYQAAAATAGMAKQKPFSLDEVLGAKQKLLLDASNRGENISDPSVRAKVEETLQRYYPGYIPTETGPKIRGLEAPATLAPGT